MIRSIQTRCPLERATNIVVLGAVALLVLGCGKPAPPTEAKMKANTAAAATKQVDCVLPEYRGSVLVLLLGMPGCPGTEAGTPQLAQWAKTMPKGATMLRLDVPPPDMPLGATTNDVGFPCRIDEGRKVASQLDFFFYPTLYLLDRDGAVRFSGAWETGKVAAMVAELVAEKTGAVKKMYTLPLLDVGTKMPAWSGTTLAGETTTLDRLTGKKATLVLFSAVSCPYSNKALDVLPRLHTDYASNGVALAIVTHSADDERTRALHTEKVPDLPVVLDERDAIGRATCHVPAVPFFFVLDAAGGIVARQPFTEGAARNALDSALGAKTAAGSTNAAVGAG